MIPIKAPGEEAGPGNIVTTTTIPQLPAVYSIDNIIDGKSYVGSSVNAQRRVEHHFYLLAREGLLYRGSVRQALHH